VLDLDKQPQTDSKSSDGTKKRACPSRRGLVLSRRGLFLSRRGIVLFRRGLVLSRRGFFLSRLVHRTHPGFSHVAHESLVFHFAGFVKIVVAGEQDLILVDNDLLGDLYNVCL
jgi:hypothetical protein